MAPSSRTERVRVVIADGRRLISEALTALIGSREGFVVSGANLYGPDPAAAIIASEPDVVLVGMGAEFEQPLELARRLRAGLAGAAIVIVADVLEPELISFVLEQGIGGLLLTDAPAREVTACLDQIAHGRSVLPSGWHTALVAERNDPVDALSERQLEVLELLADGFSYEEIGTQLFITPNTVKFHVRSIFERLGVRNRMAAARLLAKHHPR